jgi:hypothetical protein
VPKDTHRRASIDRGQLELPEQVTVALAELAGAAREGLLALAVGPAYRCCRPCSPRTSPGWSAPRAVTSRVGPRSGMAASQAR